MIHFVIFANFLCALNSPPSHTHVPKSASIEPCTNCTASLFSNPVDNHGASLKVRDPVGAMRPSSRGADRAAEEGAVGPMTIRKLNMKNR